MTSYVVQKEDYDGNKDVLGVYNNLLSAKGCRDTAITSELNSASTQYPDTLFEAIESTDQLVVFIRSSTNIISEFCTFEGIQYEYIPVNSTTQLPHVKIGVVEINNV